MCENGCGCDESAFDWFSKTAQKSVNGEKKHQQVIPRLFQHIFTLNFNRLS